MASRSLNKVQLIGNLTRDPELRYTSQGTPVCTFGVATNRSWISAAGGDRQEEAEFHRIVAWQKLAELCSQLLFKGRKVYVEGRLQTRTWTGADGQERTTTEIIIDSMIVLDSKRRPGEEGIGEARVASGLATAPATTPSGVVSPAAPTEVAAAAGPQETIVAKAATSSDNKDDKKKGKKRDGKKGNTEGPRKALAESRGKQKKAENTELKEEVKADDIPF